MSAPVRNSFWKKRSKHGRDKIFSSPDMLLQQAYEYFTHCDNNPWYKHEAIKSGEAAGTLIDIPTPRPYTLSGLHLFLDIDENTWQRYRKEESYKDFWAVIGVIDKIIYTQKFEGAVVGAFNANIISRDLGLVDKSESKNTNLNYNSIDLTPDEIKSYSKALENEC